MFGWNLVWYKIIKRDTRGNTYNKIYQTGGRLDSRHSNWANDLPCVMSLAQKSIAVIYSSLLSPTEEFAWFLNQVPGSSDKHDITFVISVTIN